MLLHGKGLEVDKDYPELLTALDEMYEIIKGYDPRNVYNMDKTGRFFRILASNKDISTTKRKREI